MTQQHKLEILHLLIKRIALRTGRIDAVCGQFIWLSSEGAVDCMNETHSRSVAASWRLISRGVAVGASSCPASWRLAVVPRRLSQTHRHGQQSTFFQV